MLVVFVQFSLIYFSYVLFAVATDDDVSDGGDVPEGGNIGVLVS